MCGPQESKHFRHDTSIPILCPSFLLQRKERKQSERTISEPHQAASYFSRSIGPSNKYNTFEEEVKSAFWGYGVPFLLQ